MLTPNVPVLLATMNLLYAVPILVSVSLVGAATRQEEMVPILQHSLRFGGSILAFMLTVIAGISVLEWLS
ncbi:MAG: hypothetical protein AAGA92_10520 [Planctomycetota bacterium]